jgi:hypothetical protein
MSEKNDKLVMELFQRVQDKKAEIEKVSRPQWETSCTIGYNPDSVQDRTNIQTVVDLKKLVELASFLIIKEGAWKEAAKAIGVSTPFSWMGYTKDQWFADFRTRAAAIEINTKKKELQRLEDKLNTLVTVEQRREMELEKIAKELA